MSASSLHTSKPTFGIAEWFGHAVQELTQEQRKYFRDEARKPTPDLPCIPRQDTRHESKCTKQGGVCSIRLFRPAGEKGKAEFGLGPIVTLCPHRFKESETIYTWVGNELIDAANPEVVGEVRFLERVSHPYRSKLWGPGNDEVEKDDDDILDDPNADVAEGEEDEGDAAESVGRIDGILVHREADRDTFEWCALEIQAVYFSGRKMSSAYKQLAEWDGEGLPFPDKRRRPDFRSSGPKRLLPQLQTKVPSLRRWGKKMAVVIDEGFFYELAEMREIASVSNSDIIWFVVGYESTENGIKLTPRFAYKTTLESAIDGLTAGQPVSKQNFEERIFDKLLAPERHERRKELQDQLDSLMDLRRPLKDRIRHFIDVMKPLRARLAGLKSQWRAADDDAARDVLQQKVITVKQQLEHLKAERQEVEGRMSGLREKCKEIRAERIRISKKLNKTR